MLDPEGYIMVSSPNQQKYNDVSNTRQQHVDGENNVPVYMNTPPSRFIPLDRLQTYVDRIKDDINDIEQEFKVS